jgi:predicted DNA-binding helix-hairpin-helix protein
MNALERLAFLSSQMNFEPAEDLDCPIPSLNFSSKRKEESIVISHALLPNGKRISMLKTLLTSACERSCNYCPFRAGRDTRRATFTPDEFAKTFMTLHRTGAVEGIFLSSGVVNGGLYTQDQLLKTAEILRSKHQYRGYLHLKIMPGVEKAQVERAMQLADRISVNLEAPNPNRLQLLAPGKRFQEELLLPLQWAEEIRRSQPGFRGWKGRWPSTVTQFVVGGVGDSDLELLSTTEYLHRQLRLGRAYFSAFHPVSNTPLEDVPSASPLREHRLYQSSYLLRDYGFSVEELPFEGEGLLPLNIDPKTAWAGEHLANQPVEINKADRHDLLRIPGIGPRSADAILSARGKGDKVRFHSLADLRQIGVNPTRAAPYILIDGKQPSHQMRLF